MDRIASSVIFFDIPLSDRTLILHDTYAYVINDILFYSLDKSNTVNYRKGRVNILLKSIFDSLDITKAVPRRRIVTKANKKRFLKYKKKLDIEELLKEG
jgi:hypothetical protein